MPISDVHEWISIKIWIVLKFDYAFLYGQKPWSMNMLHEAIEATSRRSINITNIKEVKGRSCGGPQRHQHSSLIPRHWLFKTFVLLYLAANLWNLGYFTYNLISGFSSDVAMMGLHSAIQPPGGRLSQQLLSEVTWLPQLATVAPSFSLKHLMVTKLKLETNTWNSSNLKTEGSGTMEGQNRLLPGLEWAILYSCDLSYKCLLPGVLNEAS
jgi:hypothetical protein